MAKRTGVGFRMERTGSMPDGRPVLVNPGAIREEAGRMRDGEQEKGPDADRVAEIRAEIALALMGVTPEGERDSAADQAIAERILTDADVDTILGICGVKVGRSRPEPEIVRSVSEIERVMDFAQKAVEKGASRWPGLTYEDGVAAMYDWLIGETNDAPDQD